nr:histone-lysine N-methyltransferase CLF [Tanacetum cinerariifolium]
MIKMMSKTLICSDSEEEMVDEEKDKKEFVEAEDKIRMTIEDLGSSDVVYDSLAQRMSRKPCEVKAIYEALVSQQNAIGSSNSGHTDLNAEKDLEAAQDSFDHLFCQRCLIFDCKLHGYSQELIFPAEKQRPWNGVDEDSIPCGPHCYLKVPKLDGNAGTCLIQLDIEQKIGLSSDACEILVSREKDCGPSLGKRLRSYKSDHASSNGNNVSESSDSEINTVHDATPTPNSPSTPKDISVRNRGPDHRNSNNITNDVTVSMKKRQRNIAFESEILGSGSEEANPSSPKLIFYRSRSSRRKDSSVSIGDQLTTGTDDTTQKKNEFGDEGTYKQVADFESWKTFEKSLFEKGIEMFGRNSCLIARNLMGDLKTCLEIHNAVKHFEIKLSSESRNSQDDGCVTESNKGLAQRGSKFMRRKGKTRRLKDSRKSGIFHYMKKGISDKEDLPCRQYNPCGCQSSCGDDCPCLAIHTCCEKYCGCPSSCQIRFRGCTCAKSQCRSHQCPCFAANRECDPDVCRNCWIRYEDSDLLSVKRCRIEEKKIKRRLPPNQWLTKESRFKIEEERNTCRKNYNGLSNYGQSLGSEISANLHMRAKRNLPRSHYGDQKDQVTGRTQKIVKRHQALKTEDIKTKKASRTKKRKRQHKKETKKRRFWHLDIRGELLDLFNVLDAKKNIKPASFWFGPAGQQTQQIETVRNL